MAKKKSAKHVHWANNYTRVAGNLEEALKYLQGADARIGDTQSDAWGAKLKREIRQAIKQAKQSIHTVQRVPPEGGV